jgi:hypothetical protein
MSYRLCTPDLPLSEFKIREVVDQYDGFQFKAATTDVKHAGMARVGCIYSSSYMDIGTRDCTTLVKACQHSKFRIFRKLPRLSESDNVINE